MITVSLKKDLKRLTIFAFLLLSFYLVEIFFVFLVWVYLGRESLWFEKFVFFFPAFLDEKIELKILNSQLVCGSLFTRLIRLLMAKWVCDESIVFFIVSSVSPDLANFILWSGLAFFPKRKTKNLIFNILSVSTSFFNWKRLFKNVYVKSLVRFITLETWAFMSKSFLLFHLFQYLYWISTCVTIMNLYKTFSFLALFWMFFTFTIIILRSVVVFIFNILGLSEHEMTCSSWEPYAISVMKALSVVLRQQVFS